MNATALYVSTCRYILQADFENSESWSDLYRLLPYLRQSLSCCVCGALLNDPQGPTDSNCQHFVCRTCVGGKMLLKPSCSWCKDYGKFAEVKQLRILLSCYKKLCEYIAATPIARSFVGANGESNSTLTILQEGMAITAIHEGSDISQGKSFNILDILAKTTLGKTRDTTHMKSPGRSRGPGRPRGRSSTDVRGSANSHLSGNPEVSSPVTDSRLDGLCNGLDSSDNMDTSDDHSHYSSSLSNSDSPRIKVKRKRHSSEHKSKSKKKKKKHDKDRERKAKGEKEQSKRRSDRERRNRERKKRRHRLRKESERESEEYREQSESEKEKMVNGDVAPSSPEEETPKRKSVVISGHRAKLLKAGKKLPPIEGCRCGTWSKHPGANTCCGIRCPCFMDERPCKKCKCRGCRNPFLEEITPKKRSRSSSRNEAIAESDLDIDVTNL